ncbi:MAG: hypothetical protein WD361_11105 [Gracilimonas sp.]
MKRFTGLLVILFLINGCASYKLDSAQSELRTSFASGDYSSTAQLIEKLDQKQIYKSKDRVLLYLERGLVNHFAGDYKASSKYFTDAEYQIDDLFTKSVSRAVKSFVVNDNTLAYDGEDYEDIYINVFKSLNYIHLNDLDGALVEARRVTHKLGQLDQKYNGLVEALSKADTTSTGEDKWKTGKTNVQNSALGRYLSTILFAKTNKPDNARIEFENLIKAYQDQPSVYNFDNPTAKDLEQITQPDTYNVLVQAFSGRAPVKVQNDFRIYLEESDTYLKFSLPTLETFNSQVHTIKLNVENGDIYTLNLIEEMDLVAKEVYKVKEPIIYARTIVRTFLKAIAANKMKKEAAKEDETLGAFVNIMGKIAQETTEKADLRSWQTMPGKAYSTVINLPPGEHNVIVEYYTKTGRLIYGQKQTINIAENDKLKLIESIYWN